MDAQGRRVLAGNDEAMSSVREGRRHRVTVRTACDDVHPLHLHRHSFELTRVGGRLTAGMMKDVVMLGGFQELSFDFVADNPGRTLFHCHQQVHMDFGFHGRVRVRLTHRRSD